MVERKNVFIIIGLVLIIGVMFLISNNTFSIINTDIPSNDLKGTVNSISLRNYGECDERSNTCELNNVRNIFEISDGYIEVDKNVQRVELEIYDRIDAYKNGGDFGIGTNTNSIKIYALNHETNNIDLFFEEIVNSYDINRVHVSGVSGIKNDDTNEEFIWNTGFEGRVNEREDGSKYKLIKDDCIISSFNNGVDNWNTEKTKLRECLGKKVILDKKYINNGIINITLILNIDRNTDSDATGTSFVSLDSVHVSNIISVEQPLILDLPQEEILIIQNEIEEDSSNIFVRFWNWIRNTFIG